MAAEAKAALQAEVVAVKTRWTSEIKLIKAPKDAPAYPLPLAVARTIPRTDAASAFDVDDITVRLWVDSLEAPTDSASAPVRVEVVASVPEALQSKMAEHIDARWRTELRARGAATGFLLEKLLGWAESSFTDLCQLEPSFIETYEGCNDEGMTIRRYAIAEPPPTPSESEEDGEEESEEDMEARLAKMQLNEEEERQQRIEMKAKAEADRLWREQRRAEAEALGEDAPKGPIGKKEQQRLLDEKRQRKQGTRWRKEGAKANKFDAEAAGKKAAKKGGLMH